MPRCTLLDRTDELARDRTAHDTVVEFESGAAGQRPDLDMDVGELAMPARLPLEAGMLLSALAERLLIGDLRPAMFHRQAKAVPQPVEGNGEVNLALTRKQQFVGVGVVGKAQRRVFLAQFGKRRGQLHLIGAVLGIDGKREQRLQR